MCSANESTSLVNMEVFPLYKDIFPLYKEICVGSPKYHELIQIHWDLMVNINNLIGYSNYGIMTDLQTIFLAELCNSLNNCMKRYLLNKTTLKTSIKKMESNVMMYNNNITYSDSRYIARYTPKIYIDEDCQYKLDISHWDKRVKMYSFPIVYKILPTIIFK